MNALFLHMYVYLGCWVPTKIISVLRLKVNSILRKHTKAFSRALHNIIFKAMIYLFYKQLFFHFNKENLKASTFISLNVLNIILIVIFSH